MCSAWRKLCGSARTLARLLGPGGALGPGTRRGNPVRDGRMGMKEPLHPFRRNTLREILLRQLIHRGDERIHRTDGLEAIAVGLALVEAGVCVENRHQ